MDAKSAVRWIRANAGKLGIDPSRIVAAGGSAGGHLAACTGVIPGYDEENEDKSISSAPNAMVLFNPALNTTADGWDEKRGAGLVARFGTHARALSPQHHVNKGQPPALIIHGKADTTVPFAQAQAFAAAMKAAGNRCELAGFDGQAHGFFNFGRGDNSMFIATTLAADRFLASLGYLEGEATIGK
jgi:acetyl esterase/lipase